jgi:hypothetical protein
MSSFRKNSFYIERVIPILITGGLFVHLVNLSNYIEQGEAQIGDVLHPLVDAPLAVMMLYSAVGVLYWKNFFARFAITSTWRKCCYFVIAFYIVASVPGHISYLSTGNTDYFEVFPWWFSLVLMPVYLLMILYFLTLRETRGAASRPT